MIVCINMNLSYLSSSFARSLLHICLFLEKKSCDGRGMKNKCFAVIKTFACVRKSID
jgi:hypothetical protein